MGENKVGMVVGTKKHTLWVCFFVL
jgi:hypothetical protein